jgi:hypothetical protein
MTPVSTSVTVSATATAAPGGTAPVAGDVADAGGRAPP